MVATGAGAGAAALSVAAGAAACWPFPHAVITNANAVTVAIRIHGVLKNWLIWSSTQKKSDYGHSADAPGGGSLASNNAISPIFDAFLGARIHLLHGSNPTPAGRVSREAGPRSRGREYRSSKDRRPRRRSVDAAPRRVCRETTRTRSVCGSGFAPRPRRHGLRGGDFRLPQ